MNDQTTTPPDKLDKPPARAALYWASYAGCAVLLLALAVPLLTGRVPVADDLGEFHLPARAFYANCLAQGFAFDWWPALYGGVYLTGEGQAGTYHPLHLTLYRGLPLPVAFALEVWLNYPFMLLGTYLWLQRCLRRRDLALYGALVFTFCGFNMLHIVHVNAIAVVAHIPWLLWALDRLFDPQDRRFATMLAVIAVLTGSQLLLGYPQYVWFSLIAETVYVAWRFSWRPLAALLAAKLTGLMIGAVQLFPTLDALGQSVRSCTDTAFAESGSLHPLNVTQLFAPYLFKTRVVGQNTHELGLYIGAVPFMLVVWLALRGQTELRHRRLVACFGLLGAVALLMAMGSYALVYRWQTWLPIVGNFRFPCRMIVLFHLAMAVLSAVALGAVIGRRGQVPAAASRRLGPLWYVVGFAVLLAVGAPLLWPAHVAAWPAIMAGPVLLAAAAWLIDRTERGGRWAAVALVLFAAADLGTYGISYYARTGTARLEQYRASMPQPSGERMGRVAMDVDRAAIDAPQYGNRIVLAGWNRIDGYLGLPPQRVLDYRETNALRVAGVRWLRDKNDTEDDADQISYRQVGLPLDRVRLVTRAIETTDPAATIASTRVDTTALVDSPVALKPGRPGRVSIVREVPGQTLLNTETPSPQLLVSAHSYHAGWKAFVDGQPVAVLRVYGDFVGCLVPAGRHRVELSFQPQSLKTGLTLSLCGLGLLTCGFLATHYGQRES